MVMDMRNMLCEEVIKLKSLYLLSFFLLQHDEANNSVQLVN